jgi:uncharacterized protein (DUF433 family)
MSGVRGDALTSTLDLRFEQPLYTVAEASRIVDVPASTLSEWAKGYVKRVPGRPEVTGEPVITSVVPGRRGEPSIPFVGLTEALVLAAIRRSGVPMQRVRPALAAIHEGIGLPHALASRRLFTDGAELLYDFGERRAGTPEGEVARELTVVRSGQRVFAEVIGEYLRRIEYGDDGYARLIRVPAYERAQVVADPVRSFGAPIFERGGARVVDVLDRFQAGESLEDVAAEFGVPFEHLEDVLRVASRRAA